MASCIDCGTPYPFGLDVVLPDQQWKWICPTDGLLCANCIARRAVELKGSTVLLAWIDCIDHSEERPDRWFK